MPTSTSRRRSSRRWPLAELLLAAAFSCLLNSCRSRASEPQGEAPAERRVEASPRSALDRRYFEAQRLYEEGRAEEAAGRLEGLARQAKNYPYLGDVFDLLADCYAALDRPADEYRCLLKALECYKAGGLTRRYDSREEAIERIESYLPLLRKQIKAWGGGP